jgi:hypothetical protein
VIDYRRASSRVAAVAQSSSGHLLTEAELRSKRVVLTGDALALRTKNGKWCLLDALRILLRVVGKLTVRIPPEEVALANEVREIARTSPSLCDVDIVVASHDSALHDAKAILNIGSTSIPGLPWTCVNSNGWIVRLTSVGDDLDSEMSQENPISALMAASLGVAEVFKRVIGIPAEKAPLYPTFEFSLYEHTSHPISVGPSLPSTINLPNSLLVGAGAIGNGIALLLSQLSLQGKLLIVDKEQYADENFGTCVLVGSTGWIDAEKGPRLAKWLRENSCLVVDGEKALIRDVLSRGVCTAELVIAALDDVAARHDTQLAWPRLLFDGGISDVGFGVVQHRLDDEGLACLRCGYDLPEIDHRALQAKWTGLSPSSLDRIDRTLTDDDIRQANPGRRAWLEEQRRQGKNICSLISEASLTALGVDAEGGFRPSVPFVATASSALVVGEMVKALLFPENRYSQNHTWGNVFLGVENSLSLRRPARPTCQCITHRGVIEQMRAVRA